MRSLRLKLPVRLAAAVTFHFNEGRLRHLLQVTRGLAGLPLEELEVHVFTNVEDDQRLDAIRSLCGPFFEPEPWCVNRRRCLVVHPVPGLPDPWHLPWAHKDLLNGRFLQERPDLTHFLYLEDDILFTLPNLSYFLHYVPLLEPRRLIPAFQRVEYNAARCELRLVDQVQRVDLAARAAVTIDGVSFANPDYPYQAMFLMDRRMAAEYVQSPSFDRDCSTAVRPDWGLAERAAMGLCFECPPEGYWSRYVIPLAAGRSGMAASWIHHLPDNYTTNDRVPFGKLRPDQLVGTPRSGEFWSPPRPMANVAWHLRQLPARWHHGPKRTGHDVVPKSYCEMCGRIGPGRSGCQRSGCPAVLTEARP